MKKEYIIFFCKLTNKKHDYNKFINYYAPTCFDTIVSSSGSSTYRTSTTATSTHRLYIRSPYKLRKICNNNHFISHWTILMF